jgi:hypothetical protein
MRLTTTKLLIGFILCFVLDSQTQQTITTEDLNTVKGKWTGILTYMDYRSGKPFSMPANVEIEQGKNENQLLMHINYPKESNANSKERISISKNGTEINRHEIISRKKLSDGQIEIITTYFGKDNNSKAQIKNIYILSENLFVIRKEVKFEGSEDWLVRNEYKYVR